MSNSAIDWIGYSVSVPGQHPIIITDKWQDKTDQWWWKCKKCYSGSGVISSAALEKLDSKGLMELTLEEMEPEDSKHPKEQTSSDDDDYAAYLTAYGWQGMD
jgi:hypothetical protein